MPEAGVGAPAPGGVLPSHGEIPPAEYVANLGMSVPLTRMVDAIVHKTYHNLTIMAEVLNAKTDQQKKMEIVKFVQQTRKSFIRLIALVKWANGVNKINKCSEILEFLDHQAWFFTDTADRLHTIAHVILPYARLPAFAVPSSIDVLTTGSYPDLPRAIKDRYVPPEPISTGEKAETLRRLNQVIKCRLVSSELPPRINDFEIENGILSFTVKGEFTVDLTLRGEGKDIPWELLRMKFLVEDVTSHDSRSLVHHEQLRFMHALCQSRIYKSEKPICDLYQCLHSFCISLQLEVLYSQTLKLREERWREYVAIPKYTQHHKEEGSRLVLSYWKEPHAENYTNQIIIEVNESKDWNELVVKHEPKLPSNNIKEVINASKIDHLNIEKLIMDAIKCRTRAKLEKLNFEIRRQMHVPVSPEVTEDGNRLIVPLLVPGDKSEVLDISIDPQTGDIMPLLPGASEEDLDGLADSFQDANFDKIGHVINSLRFSLAKERCRRAASSHLACRVKKLNLTSECQSSLDVLGHYVVFKLTRYVSYYMVVQLYDDVDQIGKIGRRYHLLTIEPAEENSSKMIIATSVILNANPLDQFSEFQIGLKRSVDLDDEDWLDQDAELCHVISMCDSRIPFVSLEEALKMDEIPNSGIVLESDGAAIAIRLLKFPEIADAPLKAMAKLEEQFLSLTFRLSTVKDNRVEKIGLRPNHMYWMVEVVLTLNEKILAKMINPVTSDLERVTFAYEAEANESFERINVLAEYQKDWCCVLRLYQLLIDLLNDERPELQNNWQLMSFNYQKIVIGYGDALPSAAGDSAQFSSICVVTWSYTEGAQLKFGEVKGQSAANPHSISLSQFQNELNNSKSLSNVLVQIIRSFQLCRALGRLPIHCSVGTVDDHAPPGRPHKFVARQNFSIICEQPCHYRLTFRNYYCIQFIVQSDGQVYVRDGAHSRFSNTKVLEGLSPISGLIPFFRQGTQVDDSIGEQYIRHDEQQGPMNKTLPDGVIWTGSEGAVIPMANVETLLQPTVFNMGTDGYHTNAIACRLMISPLEQFLSASFILEYIKREITREMSQSNRPTQIQLIQNTQPNANGVTPLRFATQYLRYEVQLNPQNMKFLQLTCQPNGEMFMQQNDLSTLAHYFERKVSYPPYRPNAAKAFISLLQLPPDVLCECMKLMQQELSPNVELNHRWTAQLCLTVPPSYIHFLPVGNSSIITINRPANQMQGQMQQPQFLTIFVIQLKSLGGRNMQEVTIPLKYDHNTHLTELYMTRSLPPRTPEHQTNLQQLQRINEILTVFNRQMAQANGMGNCTLYMAIQEIMNQFPIA